MRISEDEELALYEAFLNDPDARLIVPAKEGTPSVEFDDRWRDCYIWRGYLDASLILLKEALQWETRARSLIFPALFNLRHAVEVALKWHIKYAGGAVPRRAGHRLDVLIEAFQWTAESLDDEATYISDGMLDRVFELATIDPRSVAFRYSTEMDGSSIEISPRRWDLRKLYFSVDELSLWFDCLSGWIDLSGCEEYHANLRRLNASVGH